jgi:transcriptional regulator with XRE-family HTH domain
MNEKPRENTHFGEWLRREIGKRGEKQVAFSIRTGIPRASIREWMKWKAPNILPDRLNAIAAGLGMTYEEVESRLSEAREGGEIVDDRPSANLVEFHRVAIDLDVPVQRILDEAMALWKKKHIPKFSHVVDNLQDVADARDGRIRRQADREAQPKKRRKDRS